MNSQEISLTISCYHGDVPTVAPTINPTISQPTKLPIISQPTTFPSQNPTSSFPTTYPSQYPMTSQPTSPPSEFPTTSEPTRSPSFNPSTVMELWGASCDVLNVSVSINGYDGFYKKSAELTWRRAEYTKTHPRSVLSWNPSLSSWMFSLEEQASSLIYTKNVVKVPEGKQTWIYLPDVSANVIK